MSHSELRRKFLWKRKNFKRAKSFDFSKNRRPSKWKNTVKLFLENFKDAV